MPRTVSGTKVNFVDDVTVQLVDSMASDASVIRSAKVSTLGTNVVATGEDTSADYGFIDYLVRNRHGSPFEHNSFTWRITAPIFVWREFMRHRIGVSYNEESGRYKQLDPVFYVPGKNRNLVQIGKVGHYEFVPGTDRQHQEVTALLTEASVFSYESYEFLLQSGVAREVARMCLPLNVMSTAYVTMNARSLMNFLSLRVKDDTSLFKSFPQREIEMVAEKMELDFQKLMPLTHQSFCTNGRVQP